MVDNSKLDDFIANFLKDFSYEQQVKIYDKNCSSCPFKLVQVVVNQKEPKEFKTLDSAIEYLTNLSVYYGSITILRKCQYGENILSLKEIITNGCRFWKAETCEGGDNEFEPSFIEVEVIEAEEIERKIRAIESF